MWVVVTPPMSAATAEIASQLGVPGGIHRLGRTGREGCRGQVEELALASSGASASPAVRDGPLGKFEQLGREQRAGGKERVQARLAVPRG